MLTLVLPFCAAKADDKAPTTPVTPLPASATAAPCASTICCAVVKVPAVVLTANVNASMVACSLPPLARSAPEIAAKIAPILPAAVVPSKAPSLVTSGVVVVISDTPNALATAAFALVAVAASATEPVVPSEDKPAFWAAMVVNGLMFKTKLPPLDTPTVINAAFKSLLALVASSLKSLPVLASMTLAMMTSPAPTDRVVEK